MFLCVIWVDGAKTGNMEADVAGMQKDGTDATVALYARVSSDRQDVDLSVSAQLRALRDYATKNGHIVVREFIDEAESGRIASRPEFRKMIDDATGADAPFKEILVWKFSRFTRKREHAVAFKAMLRRKGVRVVSITEHADDSPMGKLMEVIIESVDEFYSENLGQEVMRGMREAASRGFWVSPQVPYGYRKVRVDDNGKQRPKLELNPPFDEVARRIFDMALRGKSSLDIAKVLNADGVRSPKGKQWRKTSIVATLSNEVYTGTLVWGATARDKGDVIRVEDAFPAIVKKQEFRRVRKLLDTRAPKWMHPRRTSSPYLLSGLLNCESCGSLMTASEAKGGKYTYYVCQTLLKKGSGACETPRLNSKWFEGLIVHQLRTNVLTEKNVRHLAIVLDEEMDGEAHALRQQLHTTDAELGEVSRRLDKLYEAVETSELGLADVAPRIRQHRERQAQLEAAVDEARAGLAERRKILDRVETIAAFAKEMSEFLHTSDLTASRAFIRSFVKGIVVSPDRAVINYTVPMPEDSPIGASKVAEFDLEAVVRSTDQLGGRYRTRTCDLFRVKEAL